MRKIIASINMTLDGFMAGPRCEMDWHFRYWTEEMAEITEKVLSEADTILLGRVTYEAMASYWSSVVYDLSFPREDLAIAEMMNSHTKVVFSRSLVRTCWKNSRIAGANIRSEIARLKGDREDRNKNILLYGSHSLVLTLLRMNLIDEYHLWIHPVFLGSGKTLFVTPPVQQLRLLHSQAFNSGVVLLRYEAGRLAGMSL